jgi:serine/threonine protein kinase
MDHQGTGHTPTHERPPGWAPPAHAAPRSARRGSLAASLAEEMDRRWDLGERPVVEEFLAQHPPLADDPEAVLDLIAEELRLRRRHGAVVPVAQLLARFPRWADQLGMLVDFHPVLEGREVGAQFPWPGEIVGDFRVLEELGRGAQGRVFLATQPALADRPVVLKVVAAHVHEHLSLARLQHTHIVPLYWAQNDPDRGLRMLCMPYFGRVTLGHLMQALPPGPQRTGAGLLAVLDAARDGHVPGPARSPLRALLQRANYTQAVCWIGACLADGLHYAHERGLLHLDVKPSNVLLAADGTPMLLDFHLAQPQVHAAGPPPFWLGGTPDYMAPEHRDAMDAVMAGRPVPAGVDGRADLYSLGALLYEALGGKLPYRPGYSPPLCRCASSVGVGLSDVIGRCLESDPGARYPDAAALADDLRRVLNDRPLRGVRNRSWRESWARWRRQRRHGLALALVTSLLATLLAAGTWQWRQRLGEAGTLLEAGRQQLRQGRYGPARENLRQGLSMARTVPGAGGLMMNLQLALDEATRQEGAADFHALVDRVRYLYPFDSLAASALGQLQGRCLQAWSRRGLVRKRLGGDEATSARLQADLLDLALLASEMGGRAGGAMRREGQRVLAEAQAESGASPVLAQARWLAGEAAAPPAEPPHTAWEHYAVGRLFLSADDLAAASHHLAVAVRLEPAGLWPNFYAGQCAYRRQRHQEAVAAFSVCVGSALDQPAPYVNRALARAALHDEDEALADYTRALELDPGFALARLNRGILHHKAGRNDDAMNDLRLALQQGADPAIVCYNLALVYQSRGDRAAAVDAVGAALRHRPGDTQASALQRALLSGGRR